MKDKITNSKLTKSKSIQSGEFYITFCHCIMDLIRTRWFIATFFIGISFIIFGFSFKISNTNLSIVFMHFSALLIYWFAFILYSTFNRYINFIVKYLINMEESKKVDINFQTNLQEFMRMQSKIPFTLRFLFWFGIFYTLIVLVIHHFFL